MHHRDPILNNRTNGWGSLPTYTFVLAGAAWTAVHLHWSWLVVARIPALLCDLGVVVVVGALVTAAGGSATRLPCAGSSTPATRSPSWSAACTASWNRPACCWRSRRMVVVLRGGPGISGRRAVAGGVLLGFAISTQSWPVLFGPALLIALPSWRRRLQAVAGGAAVGVVIFATMPLTVGTPLDKMPYLFKHMISNQPTIGTFGWAGVWVTQHHDRASGLVGPVVDPRGQDRHQGRAGRRAAGGVLVAPRPPAGRGHRHHHRAHRRSPAFGNQYLQWPVPSSIARPTRLTMPLQIVLGIYAAVFYLPMDLCTRTAWQDVDNGMMFFSLGVAAFMVIALPWHRRVWDRSQPPGPEDEDLVALDVAVSDHI